MRTEAEKSGERRRVPRSRVLLPLSSLKKVHERWSVRLDLEAFDIAELYRRGMTRGAEVWRQGMPEWRPLLTTPELARLLRHARTPLTPAAPPVQEAWEPETQLPKPPRLPFGFVPEASVDSARPSTIAPLALEADEPAPASERKSFRNRTLERVAVAAGAFLVAWLVRGALRPRPAPEVAAAQVASASAALCEPVATAQTTSAGPPIVLLSDLPVLSGRGSSATRSGSETRAASAETRASSASAHALRSSSNASSGNAAGSASAPSRADLVSALSQVARAAAGCGERPGPVRVVVTFGSSGVAKHIQVSGSDLQGEVRSCIFSAASRARVPAFTGDPVTVSKTL